MGLLRGLASRLGEKFGARAGRPTPGAPDNAAGLATLDCGAQELKERVEAGESVLVVDVRPRERSAAGSLPGARGLPLAELEARWQELAQADEIVCACDDGLQSGQAARLLRARGLINATRRGSTCAPSSRSRAACASSSAAGQRWTGPRR